MTTPIRDSIQVAFEKYKCVIYPSALDYFVNLWAKLYGCKKLEDLDKYVRILAYEFKLSEDFGIYVIGTEDIKDLYMDYIESDHLQRVTEISKNI